MFTPVGCLTINLIERSAAKLWHLGLHFLRCKDNTLGHQVVLSLDTAVAAPCLILGINARLSMINLQVGFRPRRWSWLVARLFVLIPLGAVNGELMSPTPSVLPVAQPPVPLSSEKKKKKKNTVVATAPAGVGEDGLWYKPMVGV
jgi:hypothetical protein